MAKGFEFFMKTIVKLYSSKLFATAAARWSSGFLILAAGFVALMDASNDVHAYVFSGAQDGARIRRFTFQVRTRTDF